MRTTLDIDDDVLLAARERASEGSTTIGRIISDLARESLLHECSPSPAGEAWATRNGVPLLPKREGGQVVTLELVNRLRDEEP